MKKFSAIISALVLVLFLASCVSSTRVSFYSNVEGAEVYVDGELIGNTPVTVKMSNAIWEWPDITIKKDGYEEIKDVQLAKELKVPNAVLGVLVNEFALLWVWGPKKVQHYNLVRTGKDL